MERQSPPVRRVRRPSQVFRKVAVGTAPAPSRVRAADLLLIIIFLVGILLPLTGLIFGLDTALLLEENHPPAPRPELKLERAALAEYPGKFEAYLNDQFGFRKRLIRWLALVKVLGLGVSSSPSVIVGKSGWFFFAGDLALDYYRGTKPFTPEQLEQWRRGLQSRRDWLAARGIPYIYVFLPNKDTIYPEFMPRAYNRVRPESRLDQLLAHLRAHSNVPVLDLREDVRLAKGRERLYWLTDTHWNRRAGYIAYERMIGALAAWFPAMKAVPRSAYRDIVESRPGGDLARMLGLPDRMPEELLELAPRVPYRARPADPGFRMPPGVAAYRAPLAFECNDPALPRAVMFRDSFASDLIPALSEHFRRIVYVWDYDFDRAIVERERPDVVIQEMVERSLMGPVPEDR